MATSYMCAAIQLVLLLSVVLTQTATDSPTPGPVSPTTRSYHTEPFTSDDLSTGPDDLSTGPDDLSTGPDDLSTGPDDLSTGPDGAVTQEAASMATTDLPSAVTTERATAAPTQPVLLPDVCVCDLTPAFCDVGCCCDVVDCDLPDLTTVFTGCTDQVISGVCVEEWLMFRANVDPSLINVTNKLFCIQPQNDAPQTLPALSQGQAPPPPLVAASHFSSSLTSAPPPLHTRGFYRVDDVILTQYNGSSLRSVLRQPSPGATTTSCVDRNPARFLRSVSLSCSRPLTPQTCTSDPSLNALSYHTHLSLAQLPVPETEPVADSLQVPVTPLSDWPEPSQQNGSCLNVVSQVDYIITYTGRGEITMVTVNVALANSVSEMRLTQTHAVHYQLATPPPSPAPSPLAGLAVGAPVIGGFGGEVQPLTIMGVSLGGECSADSASRIPVLFTHNTLTGCSFSSLSPSCSEVRSQLYGILRGVATPDLVAMTTGSPPDWSRVITEECPRTPEEECVSGCLLPLSLQIQVLWARLGLLALPQNHILGARFHFLCQKVKCPLVSPVSVTTEVTFVDTTVYPEVPRGAPQPDWRFPFGFFSRGGGAKETDDQMVIDGGDITQVTWYTLWLVLMVLVLD